MWSRYIQWCQVRRTVHFALSIVIFINSAVGRPLRADYFRYTSSNRKTALSLKQYVRRSS